MAEEQSTDQGAGVKKLMPCPLVISQLSLAHLATHPRCYYRLPGKGVVVLTERYCANLEVGSLTDFQGSA